MARKRKLKLIRCFGGKRPAFDGTFRRTQRAAAEILPYHPGWIGAAGGLPAGMAGNDGNL